MAQPPKLPDGTLDKITIRRMYDESRHLDWQLFCESVGWAAGVARRGLPIKQWNMAKRRRLAKATAETVENLEFEHLDLWSKDVLKTLREYPRTIDFAHALLIKKMAHMQKTMEEPEKVIKNDKGEITKRVPAGIDRVKSGSISQLIFAVEALVRAKHKALALENVSIDNVSLNKAKEHRVARDVENSPKALNTATKAFSFNVIGFEDGMSTRDVENLIANYIDTPEKLAQAEQDIVEAEVAQTPDEALPE